MHRFAGQWLLPIVASLAFSRASLAQSSSEPNPASQLLTFPSASGASTSTKPLASAWHFYCEGKLGEAETAYRDLLKDQQRSAPAYVGLMRVQIREQHLADATASLAKAAEIAPLNDEVQVAQGEMLFRQGKIAEAETIFARLVQRGNPAPRARLGLARAYWASSNYQHGKLLADLAHERDNEDPDIRRFWMQTLTPKESIAALKVDLSANEQKKQGEREPAAALLTDAEGPDGSSRNGCRLTNEVQQSRLPLLDLMNGPNHLEGYGLKMEFNGAKSTLIVDSGASNVLINRKLAEKAGIKPIAKAQVYGVGDKGAVGSFIGLAESIKIGNLEFKGCLVEVMDRNNVGESDGLIGTDFFSEFLIAVNFPDHRLDLSALPPLQPLAESEKVLISKDPNTARFRDRYVAPEMKSWTPVYRFGHMLLIPTRVNQSPPLLFLIDTGAFSNTITPDAARNFTKVRSDDSMKVKGLSGEVKNVFSADDVTLSFSHFKQPVRGMTAFNASQISEGAGTEVSGTLGIRMLYLMVIKIDYRDGLVNFEYDPYRVH